MKAWIANGLTSTVTDGYSMVYSNTVMLSGKSYLLSYVFGLHKERTCIWRFRIQFSTIDVYIGPGKGAVGGSCQPLFFELQLTFFFSLMKLKKIVIFILPR